MTLTQVDAARAADRRDVPATVLGDADLVRALSLAGVRSTVFSSAHDPGRFTRGARRWIEAVDHWLQPDELVQLLLRAVPADAARPVLYYQTDGDLLLVSRHRQELERSYRFLLPDADLVEALVDKARFSELATRLELPVPPTVAVGPGPLPVSLRSLPLPAVVKPCSRAGLIRLGAPAKARLVTGRRELLDVCGAAVDAGVEVVAQQLVPGPETCIESHHAYVDAAGVVAAEFTGVKLRTTPRRFGHSTLLATTDSATVGADVRDAGREVLERIGLRGVVKSDWKRAADGTLHLLELNPRFTLWEHLCAAAGLDFVGCVHADLTGTARPPSSRARPGATWHQPLLELHAVRRRETSLLAWGTALRRADARSGFDGGDPRPLLRALVGRLRP